MSYGAAEGKAFIQRQLNRAASGEGLSLVVQMGGSPAGCVTLMFRRPRIADLGYWLVRRARGKGLGTSVVAIAVEWALANVDLDGIEAFVADDNIASRRVLEKAGFREIGRRRHGVGRTEAEFAVFRRDA